MLAIAVNATVIDIDIDINQHGCHVKDDHITEKYFYCLLETFLSNKQARGEIVNIVHFIALLGTKITKNNLNVKQLQMWLNQ